MLQAYPVAFTRDSNGTIIAEILDIPGAMTVGRDRAQARERIQDALVVMLSGLMDRSKPIPRPSRQKKGQIAIPLPPMVAAKIAIYQAMRAIWRVNFDVTLSRPVAFWIWITTRGSTI